MDARTKKALEASIQHWEELSKTTRSGLCSAPIGTAGCALCKLFFGKLCIGCPVQAHTGEGICCETPYVEASQAKSAGDLAGFVRYAKEEVAFLKSLREKV